MKQYTPRSKINDRVFDKQNHWIFKISLPLEKWGIITQSQEDNYTNYFSWKLQSNNTRNINMKT